MSWLAKFSWQILFHLGENQPLTTAFRQIYLFFQNQFLKFLFFVLIENDKEL